MPDRLTPDQLAEGRRLHSAYTNDGHESDVETPLVEHERETRQSTHWDGCHEHHLECALRRLGEVEQERDDNRDLLRDVRRRLRHDFLCPVVVGYSYPCNCGHDDILEAVTTALGDPRD